MGPSAIPNEIPVNTGYLMRICETLHSTPAIGRAIVIATTQACVYVYVYAICCWVASYCISIMRPALCLLRLSASSPRGRLVGQTAPGRPLSEPVAAQLPGAQPRAHSLRGWHISVRKRLNGSNSITATCNILKRTEVNPLYLSRNLIL